MNLAAILAAAIIAIAPRVPPETAARYATDIDNAIGPDELTLGFALVATARWESAFRPEIERCECMRHECDSDRQGKPHAFGLYQLHKQKFGAYTAADICASNAISTERAAVTMRELFARARNRWWKTFTFYVGGESASVVGRRRDFDWMRSNRAALAEKGEALCQGW